MVALQVGRFATLLLGRYPRAVGKEAPRSRIDGAIRQGNRIASSPEFPPWTISTPLGTQIYFGLHFGLACEAKAFQMSSAPTVSDSGKVSGCGSGSNYELNVPAAPLLVLGSASCESCPCLSILDMDPDMTKYFALLIPIQGKYSAP